MHPRGSRYVPQGVEMAFGMHMSNNQGVNVLSERTPEMLILDYNMYLFYLYTLIAFYINTQHVQLATRTCRYLAGY